MTVAIWAYSGIVPALTGDSRGSSWAGIPANKWPSSLVLTHQAECVDASSHFSFPGIERIVSIKVRRPEEQQENSVLWGIVFRTFVLIQFEWGPDECGAYIMSYCLSLQNMLQIHQLLSTLHGQDSITSCLDDCSGLTNEPFTTQKPEWSLSKVNQILSLCCSNPSQGTLLPSAPKFKLLTLTRPCMTEPLLLSPALSQVPLSFLPSTVAHMVTLQFQMPQAPYCLENVTHLFCVPRILCALGFLPPSFYISLLFVLQVSSN